jgi:hypothetical protein
MAKVLLASLFGDIPQEQMTYVLLSSIASSQTLHHSQDCHKNVSPWFEPMIIDR